MSTVFGIPVSLTQYAVLAPAGLLLYVVTTHLQDRLRSSSAAIGWVLFIVLLPHVAIPLFLVFGTRKFRRRERIFGQPPASPVAALGPGWATQTLEAMGMPPATANAAVTRHADGEEALARLLELIAAARRSLELSSYLLGNDPVGDRIVAALAASARAGVSVRLLLDWIGSLRCARRHVRALRAAGVEVRWFMPLIRNPLHGRTNLRNHRKLAIADAQWVWSGGRNLAAEYFVGANGAPAWLDLSFDVRGPLAAQILGIFEKDWNSADGSMRRPESTPGTVPACPPGAATGHVAQPVPSGPDEADDTVYTLLLSALHRAERRVLAVTAYILPDDALIAALSITARRGVAVDLYIPEASNHRLADLARHRGLRELARQGCRIHLVRPMAHAKAVVVDDMIAIAGSSNLDGRSLFLNFELMVAFYSPADIAAIAQWVGALGGRSQPYRPQAPSLLRDIAEGLTLWIAFQL
jgi:cardiolipin synthase A/B